MQEILFDPQTSGGLLASIDAADAEAALKELEELGLPCGIVGRIEARQEKAVIVE